MKNNYNEIKAEVLKIRSETEITRWIFRFGQSGSPSVSVRKQENIVENCDIHIWISGKKISSSENNADFWKFEYDSINMFNRSIVRLVAEMFDGMTTDEINECGLSDFIDIAKFYPDVKKRNLLMIINKVKSIVNNS